ncbi:MAG: XrtA-associated tyrosine autokinase [Gammaproteobacteria bacterium]|nr:XrtA-associated tyrosine autokinase [Gammaproteobacteria bacterium]MDH5652384.1 XrtA-associated tyrosine autokinase [Gammaproteobacteria bacterium]
MSIIEKAVARIGKTSAPSDNTRPAENTAVGHVDSTVGRFNKITVCHLNVKALKEQGYLTSGDKNSRFAEQYRQIKRPLLKNAFSKMGDHPVENGNLIMVTSAIHGEGKTFTAMNLALSIALEKDTTVLLVDCDLEKPKLSRLLGVESQTGLIDILDNPGKDLGEAIIGTDINNFRIMPAGRPNEFSTELLASETMYNIAQELSKRYSDRVIIFDAPPFLGSTQARVLTDFVGQILVVVAAGETNKNIVRELTQSIRGNKIVGMVLNKCKPDISNVYRGYGEEHGRE